MDRNLFGGSAADVAEDVDGKRVAGAPVTIWDGPTDTANRVMDLQDPDGTVLDSGVLVADPHGYLPSFLGPPGVERLWADSGVRRVEVLPVNLGTRLRQHMEVEPDPHGAREYADSKFAQAVKLSGANMATAPSTDPYLTVEAPARSGDVLRVTRAGAQGTAITSAGCVIVAPSEDLTPLRVDVSALAASRPAITVGAGTGQVLRLYPTGALDTVGPITAPNVGTAPVFSGPTPPANPRPGTVWVAYGT
ncbi:hypothetical protein [Streptomyces luteireticuli]|uniref:Uncharacterized protein n=1 Tax=Streptomyces luteireticuli TaxID=173858 RepID=A0ABP3IJ49_9ACTN